VDDGVPFAAPFLRSLFQAAMSTTAPPAPPSSILDRVLNDAPASAEMYLSRETDQAAKERLEFVDGWIVRMPGGSKEHQLVLSNVTGELRQRLRTSDYRVVASGLKVRLPGDPDGYTYPDAIVFSAHAEFEGEQSDILLEPIVLVEILSPSTSDYDLGTKFRRYRRLSTLREYVAIDPFTPHVERHVRRDDDAWVLNETNDLAANLELASVDVTLPLF